MCWLYTNYSDPVNKSIESLFSWQKWWFIINPTNPSKRKSLLFHHVTLKVWRIGFTITLCYSILICTCVFLLLMETLIHYFSLMLKTVSLSEILFSIGARNNESPFPPPASTNGDWITKCDSKRLFSKLKVTTEYKTQADRKNKSKCKGIS